MPSIHIPEDTFRKYVKKYGYEEAKIRIKQATDLLAYETASFMLLILIVILLLDD